MDERSRDFVRRLLLPFLAYVAIGWWVASSLAAAPDFTADKGVLLASLVFEIAGVLALSHLATNQRVESFIVGPFIDQFNGFFLGLAVGVMVRGFHFPGPTPNAELTAFVPQLMMLVATPLAISAYLLFENRALTDKSRASALGLVLVVWGLVLQLISAFQDIYS